MKANATIRQETRIGDYGINILWSDLNDMLTKHFDSEIGPVFIDVLKKYYEVVFKEPELDEQRDLCRQWCSYCHMFSKPDFFCAAARKVEAEDLREEEGK